jgi:hypothetical protein
MHNSAYTPAKPAAPRPPAPERSTGNTPPSVYTPAKSPPPPPAPARGSSSSR